MRVFTLAVLPAHPAYVPVLADNMAAQGVEDHLPVIIDRKFPPSQINKEGRCVS